ncbi:MAG: hypothetical protein LLG04_02610 [Parachlamydia sp.]|nr:hypothetical protein [Parachlamydia sp.]
MLRWNDVKDTTVFGITFKMYRQPFVAADSIKSIYKNLELDHYAYKYFESELFAYRILDTNFVQYMEERGDLSRMKDVLIPTLKDDVNTVL